jgi:hypothetical protein
VAIEAALIEFINDELLSPTDGNAAAQAAAALAGNGANGGGGGGLSAGKAETLVDGLHKARGAWRLLAAQAMRLPRACDARERGADALALFLLSLSSLPCAPVRASVRSCLFDVWAHRSA